MIDPQQHRADLLGAFIGPVLERLLDKIGQRHDHPPQIPDADHDIGAGDRFDPTRFALDHDLILDPERLGDRDLDAGEQIAQHRARRETQNQAGGTGRGEQADPVLPDRVEGHQRGGDRDEGQQGFRDPLQDPHLGDVLAGEQVVFDIGAETAQIDRYRNVDRDRRRPADVQDERQQQGTRPIAIVVA